MKNRKSGFTLVEIIISLALISILAIGLIPAFAAQMKMTVDTKNITMQTFDAQGEVERVIQSLQAALGTDPVDISSFAGVTVVPKTWYNRSVYMYKLVQEFPSNDNKDFIVFLSQKLADNQVLNFLQMDYVNIEVSGQTVHEVASLSKDPYLTGKYRVITNSNFYCNLFNWYVSKEGDPNPVFPDDYEIINYKVNGVTPDVLPNSILKKYANKFIGFTVTPVDIHGVRGYEKDSSNTIYVMGEEWRGGVFAWVDKNADITYTSDGTDVPINKSITLPQIWPLINEFDTANPITDPESMGSLDPSKGSLYVPMCIGTSGSGVSVAPIEITGNNSMLHWTVDKGINLATDITVSSTAHNQDIYMKVKDDASNIVLYQYIELAANGDAVFQSNGMPSLTPFGPKLTTPNGEIYFATGKKGDVILQKYSELNAGSGISLIPFGHVSLYKSVLNTGNSILLDTTGGSSYPGDRDIIIQDSVLSLKADSNTNRSITVKTLNTLDISGTKFYGNTQASSNVVLKALDGIILKKTDFVDCAIQIENNTAMTGGSWDSKSTLTVPDGKMVSFNASGDKVANDGVLNLGDTGGVSFGTNNTADLSKPLTISLNIGGNTNQVDIDTINYNRNIEYADGSSEIVSVDGTDYKLGIGSTNMEYEVVKYPGGYGTPSISCTYDGKHTITIDASGTDAISHYYALNVKDLYAEGVTGTIDFKVKKASEDASPTVTVLDTSVPTYTVTFDANGGTTPAAPSTKIVIDGDSVGTLPTPPTLARYSFMGWKTAQTGGDTFTKDTTVTESITVYAQWTPLPLCTVTFDSNSGGAGTQASPSTMAAIQGESLGTLPTPPKWAGHIFGYWLSPVTNQEFNETTLVTAPITVNAQWTAKGTFASIAIGKYVRFNDDTDEVLFQKVGTNALLAKNRIYYGTSYNMKWSNASAVASNFGSAYPNWSSSSGLLNYTILNSLNTKAYRNDILSGFTYQWWGESFTNYGTTYAYIIDTDGKRYYTNSLNTNYSCRPYITLIQPENIFYESAVAGDYSHPYILTRD